MISHSYSALSTHHPELPEFHHQGLQKNNNAGINGARNGEFPRSCVRPPATSEYEPEHEFEQQPKNHSWQLNRDRENLCTVHSAHRIRPIGGVFVMKITAIGEKTSGFYRHHGSWLAYLRWPLLYCFLYLAGVA